MQRLEVRGAVRHIYGSLDVKRITNRASIISSNTSSHAVRFTLLYIAVTCNMFVCIVMFITYLRPQIQML